jgi:hypothetical protein
LKLGGSGYSPKIKQTGFDHKDMGIKRVEETQHTKKKGKEI